MNSINIYIERNKKWLMPLVAIFVILTATGMMNSLTAPGEAPLVTIPRAFYFITISLGGLFVGFGAKVTDTMSATIVEYLILLAGTVLALSVIFSN